MWAPGRVADEAASISDANTVDARRLSQQRLSRARSPPDLSQLVLLRDVCGATSLSNSVVVTHSTAQCIPGVLTAQVLVSVC